jgi:signal transduction histidine kinase
MAIPIAVDAEACGLLYVADRRDTPFSEEDLAFLTLVAGRVGLLLERAELTRTQREVERQRAQAEARQELLAIVSHELKTPIAVMRAYAEVLIGRAQKSQRTEEADLLQRIEDQAERLLAMVEQVLDLQRLDAGLFPLEVSHVDLVDLVRRAVRGLELAEPDVRFALRSDVAPVEVRADRRRVEQVLLNLLQNAVRFCPRGGEVTVQVSRADTLPTAVAAGRASEGAADGGPGALVSVSDQGPGVPAAERVRIFERFYQGLGGATLRRGHGGLGVGLYIAREIVLRHGGLIWLDPAAPGGPDRQDRQDGNTTGASFTFALPTAGPPDLERDEPG